MHSERYATGLNILRQVDGKSGEVVLESLRDIAPDFARYLIEFPFGDIYAPSRTRSEEQGNRGGRRPDRLGQRKSTAQGAYLRRAACGLHAGRDCGSHHADGRIRRIPGGSERPVRRQGDFCGSR